jgi:hypothetical protein
MAPSEGLSGAPDWSRGAQAGQGARFTRRPGYATRSPRRNPRAGGPRLAGGPRVDGEGGRG